MKKMLIGLVAVAMLAGVAMAETKDISKMTAREKYDYGRALPLRDEEMISVLTEIKDSPDLSADEQADVYMRIGWDDAPLMAVARERVSDKTDHAYGLILSRLIELTGGEKVYVDEMVSLKGTWERYPYEAITTRYLKDSSRNDMAIHVVMHPRARIAQVKSRLALIEPTDDIRMVDVVGDYIDTLADRDYGWRRRAVVLYPRLEDGKLVGESFMGVAIDAITGSRHLSLQEKDDLLTKLAGMLSVADPVQRIMLEAVLSERDAVRKIME
jgi:hypothetical protein